VRAITELIWNVSLVRKKRLENVVRVGFDAMEKVIVGSFEQVDDNRHIIATATEPFAVAQQRVKMCAVRRRACPTMLAPHTECARQPSHGKYCAATSTMRVQHLHRRLVPDDSSVVT